MDMSMQMHQEPSEMSQREFFCHWLARVYEAGHRDTSYEEGETLDSVLREINQVLGFAGYEPCTDDRKKLLATRPASWIAPDPALQTPLDILARDFIYAEDCQEAYDELEESNSASTPPEFLALAEAVMQRFGPPLVDEDRAAATIDPAKREAAREAIAGETEGEYTGEQYVRKIEQELEIEAKGNQGERDGSN